MARIDEGVVKFGTVDKWVAGMVEGRRTGGYGWVRGRGQNAGQAWFHINARITPRSDTFYGGADAIARLGQETFPSDTRVPKTGDHVVLEVEHAEKGLQAKWWCFKDEWDAAIAKRDAHNVERERRMGARTALEFALARSGWPNLSLVPTLGHEGEELLGGRYHNRLVAKKDRHSNTVGAVVQQTIKREGVEVERKTELPQGVRYIERAHYLTPPKPEHLYVERAEAVEETEVLLGVPFEQWGIAVEFPAKVLRELGGRAEELSVDVAAGKASYKLVSPRFGEQTINATFSPEKADIDARHSSLHRAYLSGFIAPEVNEDLMHAFAAKAEASRKPIAVYRARHEVAALEDARKGWSEGYRGAGAPPARILALLEEGIMLEYSSYQSSYNSGWVQAIYFGPQVADREFFQLGHAEHEALRALEDSYRVEREQAGRSSMFSSGLLSLDHGDPRYQAALRQVVAARIRADHEELWQRYAKAMERELDFSAHGGYGETPEAWYATELPQELSGELAMRLAELRGWWVDLEEVNATIEAALVRHGAAAAQEAEDAQTLVVSAEQAVASLQQEYGSEVRLSRFCEDEFYSARHALDRAHYADVRTQAQKILDACAGRRAELDAKRVEQARAEEEALAAMRAREEVVADLEKLAYGYYGGASEFTSAADKQRFAAADLEREIADAFERRRYTMVVEKAQQARELIAAVRERQAASARRATEETLRLARIQQGVPEPARVVDGTMKEAGKRHFRCSCGRMEKAGGSDWQQYQAGQPLTITCGGCGKVATVKK